MAAPDRTKAQRAAGAYSLPFLFQPLVRMPAERV